MSVEQNFYELCLKYDNKANNDYKGSLLYKAYENEKYGEELLASYIMVKEKFDSVYAFLLTKTRIIEINSYSTMYIVTTKKFKYISKVTVEQEFDDKLIKEILNDEVIPERVQLRVQFVDYRNEIEELVWEGIEKKEDIIQVLNFANKLKQIQATS